MSLNGGQHYSSGRRVQLSTGNTLLYTLYSDAALQTPIPVDQNVTILSVGSGTNITLPVYGKIVLPGIAAAGTYTDTIVVTLTW